MTLSFPSRSPVSVNGRRDVRGMVGMMNWGIRCSTRVPPSLSSSSEESRVSDRRLSEASSRGLEDALSMDSRDAGLDDTTERDLRWGCMLRG